MKAPNNNVLNFILSKKVILVEGDAEYILMEQLFKNVTSSELSLNDIHIISVGGTSFSRYLEIARILEIKTAVIRDNDHKYEEKCIRDFEEYVCDYIKIFFVSDNLKYTFEVCFYDVNTQLCDELFEAGRRTLSVLDFMLGNKTEVAFKLLDKKGNVLNVPDYIRECDIMDKRVIFAVAGSGKTTYIIDQIDEFSKSLIITFTNNNYDNLRKKIIKKFGYLPSTIKILTYFTFLHSFCYKPYLLFKYHTKGIEYKLAPNIYAKGRQKYYQVRPAIL